MKNRWLTRVTKHLESLGYIFEEDTKWQRIGRLEMAFRYVKKGRGYFAVTVSHYTGALLIEVLKRKERIDIPKPMIDI